jgi:hypothetical protein
LRTMRLRGLRRLRPGRRRRSHGRGNEAGAGG